MMRFIYTLLLTLILPFTPLKLLWRGRKQPEYRQHWQERYGFYSQKPSKPVIWLHSVSVGETHAASPLIKYLLETYPDHTILLSHTTPTGRATSEQLFGDRVMRVYLPYDIPWAVCKFLTYFQPKVGLLIETELWFNLLHEAKKRNIPMLLVNARLSERSAKGYAKLGDFMAQALENLALVAAQTHADAERFETLGLEHAHVMGNLKFDVTPPADAASRGLALRQQLHAEQRPVWLAASTRDSGTHNEESLILDAYDQAKLANLLLVLVPRHPQRFDAVETLLKSRGYRYIRRSQLHELTDIPEDIQVVLGDSMGEMFTYYAACDVAFIGGSLLPLGGQNLIEAAAVGKPVLIGPHTYNFAQAATVAVELGAAWRVQDAASLAAKLQALFADSTLLSQASVAALKFSTENRGATERCLTFVNPYIA